VTFKEAMREIESHEFGARLNVASDFNTFLKVARDQEATQALVGLLFEKQRQKVLLYQQELLYRIFELSQQRVDPRYENPWDTAFAVYIWAINLIDWDLSKLVAERVSRIANCWWARKISLYILLEQQKQKAGYEQQFMIFSGKIPSWDIKNNAVETFVPIGLDFISKPIIRRLLPGKLEDRTQNLSFYCEKGVSRVVFENTGARNVLL
jgi:hypothetical protein